MSAEWLEAEQAAMWSYSTKRSIPSPAAVKHWKSEIVEDQPRPPPRPPNPPPPPEGHSRDMWPAKKKLEINCWALILKACIVLEDQLIEICSGLNKTSKAANYYYRPRLPSSSWYFKTQQRTLSHLARVRQIKCLASIQH